jgi:hypothetical protein
MPNDTRRWLDTDLPNELQVVLSSAREDHARPAQVANLRAHLEHALGPAAFSARAATGDTTAARSGNGETFATKLFGASPSGLGSAAWIVGSIVALGLGAITARMVWSPHEAGHSAAPPKSSQPSAAGASTPREQAVGNEALGSAASPEAAPAATASRARIRTTLRAREQFSNIAAPEPKPRAPVTLAEELRSLARIRSEMHNPTRALAAAARHAKRFPAGALVPERELLQLEALLKAGQAARAQRLAARLTGADHPYRAQALQLLAEHGGGAAR